VIRVIMTLADDNFIVAAVEEGRARSSTPNTSLPRLLCLRASLSVHCTMSAPGRKYRICKVQSDIGYGSGVWYISVKPLLRRFFRDVGFVLLLIATGQKIQIFVRTKEILHMFGKTAVD
jgi:hypothetical protein